MIWAAFVVFILGGVASFISDVEESRDLEWHGLHWQTLFFFFLTAGTVALYELTP